MGAFEIQSRLKSHDRGNSLVIGRYVLQVAELCSLRASRLSFGQNTLEMY